MERAACYIKSRLEDCFPAAYTERGIMALFEHGKLTAETPLERAYEIFTASMEHPAYALLASGRRPFDVTVLFDKWKGRLEEMGARIEEKVHPEYFLVTDGFVGVKLRSRAYVFDKPIPKHAVPFQKVFRAMRKNVDFDAMTFREVLFDTPRLGDDQKYLELVEDLRSIDLPIRIVGDDFVGGRGTESASEYRACNLELEDREWPRDLDAIRCAKTALYCFIHRKCPHRYLLNKDFLVLRYKGTNFMVEINVEERALSAFRELVRRKEDSWKEGVRMVKTVLGHHGFYPIYYGDDLVDLMCMEIDEYWPGSFFGVFVRRQFDCDRIFLVDTLRFEPHRDLALGYQGTKSRMAVPGSVVSARFRTLCNFFRGEVFRPFDRSFNLVTEKYLVPNIGDYDFCLCMSKRAGFKRVEQKMRRVIPTLEIRKLLDLGFFFYSVPMKLLMVRARHGIDHRLLCNVVLAKIPFEYVRIIR